MARIKEAGDDAERVATSVAPFQVKAKYVPRRFVENAGAVGIKNRGESLSKMD